MGCLISTEKSIITSNDNKKLRTISAQKIEIKIITKKITQNYVTTRETKNSFQIKHYK